MSVTAGNRKRKIDTTGPLEPTDVWHGKTWFDFNENKLKIYSETSGAWLSESEFTWIVVKASTVSSPSGGAYTP